MAHTPGPWEVTQDFNNPAHDDKSSAVCMVADPQYCVAEVCGDVGPEAVANAHLIAAAPELLAALKELVEALRREAPGTALNNHEFDAIGIQANNAIAKAEGRS